MQRWFWFIKKWSECLNGSIYQCLQTGNSIIPNMVLTNKTKTWTQLYKLILYKYVCDIILMMFKFVLFLYVLKYASFLSSDFGVKNYLEHFYMKHTEKPLSFHTIPNIHNILHIYLSLFHKFESFILWPPRPFFH